MNRVFLTGHLTRAPEMKLTPDGSAKVASFGMAINERWTDQSTGEPRENVCFVEISAWNRQAELVFEYFKKGSPILIEGSLRFESWESDGQTRSRVTVRLARFEFMTQRNGTPPDNAEVEPSPTQDTQPTEHRPQQSGDEQSPF